MDNETAELIRELRDLYRDDGIEAARLYVEKEPIQRRQAMDSVLNEFEEKERHTAIFNQNEELRKLAVATLDSQREENKTQTRILGALIATIAVTLLIAIFKD